MDADALVGLFPFLRPCPTGGAIRLPMTMDGGTYVVQYVIGSTPVRGVVDTGSPFITMEGRCGDYWGCLKPTDARLSGLQETFEVYGLQVDGSTKWVMGDVQFEGATSVSGRRAQGSSDTQAVGAGEAAAVVPASMSSVPGRRQRFVFNEVVFGVTSETSSRAGGSSVGNAPFVGLVKERAEWIRPTFLGQTDIVAFALDFVNDELTLSRTDLIPPRPTEGATDGAAAVEGVLPLVDLRFTLGAPVFHYAVNVEELWVNGGRVRVDRPIYVVLDSGTTGCLVDKELFYSSDFSLGTFEVRGERASRSND